MSEQPEPGLVRVEKTSKRPNAVVLDRRTVTLTVLALLLGTFGGWALNRNDVQEATTAAEAAAAQSSSNEQVIETVQAQAIENGMLLEKGVDCIIALQQDAVRNAENANEAAALAHGYAIPLLPNVVQIPDSEQQRFIEDACPRFFDAQAVANPASPP